MRTKVILTGSVENLGDQGDTVQVAAGYARNYLLPKGLAILATAGNLRRVDSLKKRRVAALAAQLEEAKEVAAKLAGVTLAITAPVGADGKLFGSVTTTQVAERLQEQGYTVDRKKITIDPPIREVGQFEVAVKLHPELSINVPLHVTAGEAAPAAAAAPTPARRRSTRKERSET